MRYLRYAFLALCPGLPFLAFGSNVTFSNHTQNSAQNFSGGAAFYQHADMNNNDGREDLVWEYTPEMGGYYQFVVQLSTGDGAYAPPTAYSLPSNAEIAAITVGDFNHDGSPDVAIFGQDNNLYLFLNNGRGTLTAGKQSSYSTDTSGDGVTVATGDFNHDSMTDLAFVESGILHIWFGDGKGSFTLGPTMAVNGSNPQIGDFDGDGKADLLLNDNANHTIAYVLYGDGTGHFPQTTTVTFNTPAWASPNTDYVDFTVGDANSDGKTDIIATQPGVYTNRVFVYYGDASRQFASNTNMLLGRCVTGSATVGDLDGNGLNDLIVPEHDCNNPSTGTRYIDVLTRNPDSSYNPDQTVYWAQALGGTVYDIPSPAQVIRGNGDTRPDLLVEECADSRCDAYTTTVQLNTTIGNFPTCNAPAAASGINICSPMMDGSVASPVSFQIGASGTVPMRDVEVWVDGTKMAEQVDGFSGYTFLNKNVDLTPGDHQVDVYAAGWDQSLQKKSFTLDVQ